MVSWKRKRRKKKRKRTSGGAGESPSPVRGSAEEDKVPRGHVPMLLSTGDGDGGGDGERVRVPVRLLSDPSVAELLDMAAQRYGYGQPGVLRVPCDAGHFRQVLDSAMQQSSLK